MSSDVRVKRVKVSDNGRWFLADFEFVVRSSTLDFPNGSKSTSGTTAGIVARWDLQNPQLDPWISTPIRERYYDFLISNQGNLVFAAVEDKERGNLAVWKSDRPELKYEIPFRQDSSLNPPLWVFDVKFSPSTRRIFVEMDKGLLVLDL